MKIGFVGLGQMGSMMARRLVGWPGGLTVFDLCSEAAKQLAELGATAVNSVGEVAEGSDLVCVMVLDDDQVQGVVDEILGSAAAGTIITVHSTIRPETAESLATKALGQGMHLLDVPVSGGPAGARDGRLALLAGGDRAAFETCREPFALMAEVVVHFGPPGAGTRAKLARNLINFVGIAAALEASRVAGACGVDVRKLARVTVHSDSLNGGPGAIMVRQDTGPLAPDDPLRPIFEHTLALGRKDLSLVLELAQAIGVALPLSEVALERLPDYLGLPEGEVS